ncbi:MAG: hypothetical protein E6H63_04960 [Betaproteobacteria bacterium]|nr:MAG: hypothetical protein E6H63_04960 [Betaproteobacteria bacterium]
MSDLAALVVQQSLNGVYLGCLYVMVALGLTLIYGVLNQINFAHADFVTVGAFTARTPRPISSRSSPRSAWVHCSAWRSTQRCSRRCANAATSCGPSSRRSASPCFWKMPSSRSSAQFRTSSTRRSRARHCVSGASSSARRARSSCASPPRRSPLCTPFFASLSSARRCARSRRTVRPPG